MKKLWIMLAAAVCILTAQRWVFAQEDVQVLVNETYENYATGTAPTGRLKFEDSSPVVRYCNGRMEVVEDGPGNKAMVFHADDRECSLYERITATVSRFVTSYDLKLLNGRVENISIGVGTAYAYGNPLPLVSVVGNRLMRYDGIELGTLTGNQYHNLALVVKDCSYFDFYLDGEALCKDVRLPNILISTSNIMVVLLREPDQNEAMMDNFRVYSGDKLIDTFENQPYNSDRYDYINVENDCGDYMYFDSTNVDNMRAAYSTSKYVNFGVTLTDDVNTLVCDRLYHMDPNRKDSYIKMSKKSQNQCFFTITLTRDVSIMDNNKGTSRRFFDYYLIEGDYMIPEVNTEIYLPIIYDNVSYRSAVSEIPVMAQTNGSLKFDDGTVLSDAYKLGEWFNIKLAVDMPKHTMDVYLNDKLVKEGMPMQQNFRNLTLVRYMMPGGAAGNSTVWIDNLKIVGLVNRFENGTVERTSVFTDEKREREYLADKVAFHELNNLMFANGEKTKMSAEQIYDQEEKELYIPLADAQRAFGDELKVQDGKLLWKGETYTPEHRVRDRGEALYIPVLETAEKLLGKYVFHHEETGLIIIGDTEIRLDTEHWDYYSSRGNIKYSVLNDIDYLNNMMVCERPDPQELLQDAYKTIGSLDSHPRLMLTQEDVTRMKGLIQTDEKFKLLYDRMIAYVEKEMEKPLTPYSYQGGTDPLRMNIDPYRERMISLCMAWLLTDDQKYFDRAYQELVTVSKFPDYNAATVHDAGKWIEPVALSYDWLYNGMTPEQRESLGKTILNHIIRPYADGVYGWFRGRNGSADWGNMKWFTNMGTIYEAGIIAGGSAVLEIDPEYCTDVISKAMYGLEYPMGLYAPNGAWTEGPSYWDFNTESVGYCLLSLDGTFGSRYGLDKMKGFDKNDQFIMAVTGPNGVFAMGDASPPPYYNHYAMSLNGKMLQSDAMLQMRYFLIANNRVSVSGLDLLAYTGREPEATEMQYGTYIPGMEIYTIRASMDLNSEDVFFSAGFGAVTHYHSHNDWGNFVLDLQGVRWAEDLGMENYTIQNQLGYQDKQLYRKRAEGHNLLVINPADHANSFEQVENSFSPVERAESNQYGGYVIADLSDIYQEVNSGKLGYYVGDNMKTVTVRYEIDLKGESELYWFMHTRATAAYTTDNLAYLSMGDKHLAVTYETDAEESDISMMAAAPLPTSPQVPEQNANAGIQKVAIHMKANGKMTLTVKLTPMGMNLSPLDIMDTPMEQWALPEEAEEIDAAPANLNVKIYSGGEEVAPDSRIRVIDGAIPEVTAVAEDPNNVVEIHQAENIDQETGVIVRTPDGRQLAISTLGYYVPYVSSFTGYDVVPIESVEVSSVPQPQNGKDHMLDDDMTTRWTCMALEEYAIFDLGEPKDIDAISLAFWKGVERNYFFEILTSEDGENFQLAYKGQTEVKQNDSDYTVVDFAPVKARYIKYINHGNTGDGTAAYNGNILEFKALKRNY